MITFQSQEITFKVKQQKLIKDWLKALVTKEKKELGDLNYVFMSDEQLVKHNIQYLNHNTLTDIITFDYCEGKKINGDILISVERVKENAQKFEVSFESELHRVMAHGLMHLCGYKDKKTADVEVMRKKENAALKLWRIFKDR